MVNNHSTTKTRSCWSMTALNKSTFALSVCLVAALSFSAPQSMAKPNKSQGPAKEKIKRPNKGKGAKPKRGKKRLTDEQREKFMATVEYYREFYDIPGVAIAIVEGDDVENDDIDAKGFGVRSLETQELVTPDTLFLINSMTKPVTSAMIAALMDDEAIDSRLLKRRVVDIMPDFKLLTDELTQSVLVRHLMEMNTGLADDEIESFYGRLVFGASVQELFSSLDEFPIVSGAGDDIFDHNNTLFSVAGFIAALVSCKYNDLDAECNDLYTKYKKLMQKRMFDPIGMKSALLTRNLPAVGGDYASGHAFNFVTSQVEAFSHPPVNDLSYAPVGGVSASALDIARYLIMQLKKGIAPDGHRVVSVKNLMKTRQPRIEISSPLSSIAYPLAQSLHNSMGWIVAKQVNGVKMLVETGSGERGFITDMSFIPEADVGLVILTNRMFFSSLFPSGVLFLATVRASFFELIYNNEPTTTEKVKNVIDTYAAQYENSKQQAAIFRQDFTQVNFTLDDTVEPYVEPYLGNYEKGWYVEWRDEETINQDGEAEGTLWIGIEGLEYQLVFLRNFGIFMVGNNGLPGMPVSFLDDEGTITMNFGPDAVVKVD